MGEVSGRRTSATLKLAVEVGKLKDDHIEVPRRHFIQEIDPRHPGDLCGAFLRNLAQVIEVDGGGESQLAHELLRGAVERGERLISERNDGTRHHAPYRKGIVR